jgi:hypothetical protein
MSRPVLPLTQKAALADQEWPYFPTCRDPDKGIFRVTGKCLSSHWANRMNQSLMTRDRVIRFTGKNQEGPAGVTGKPFTKANPVVGAVSPLLP